MPKMVWTSQVRDVTAESDEKKVLFEKEQKHPQSGDQPTLKQKKI